MEIITSKEEMQQRAKAYRSQGKSIGFVPTMGYLHEGHLSLVREARKENDLVVMSIFVNPLQFGPGEDYEAYPRDAKRDQKMAENAGVDILFMPEVNEMYNKELSMKIIVTQRTDVLCGSKRPGHFDGVVTVLSKLFHIVLPERAYFGLKDAQQFAVVSAFVEDLDFPLELVPVKTIREPSGLAISSRNVYLTDEEREQAPHLYKSLQLGESLIGKGEKDPAVIKDKIIAYLKKNTKAEIDYIAILSYPDLEPLPFPEGKMIIAAAVKFSKARLIDNIILTV